MSAAVADVMRVGSMFSGVGGFDLGFERAGFEVAWQCEIDKHARAVLARHWPGVHCYPDVRGVVRGVPAVDVLVGGFPCQDVSVAGLREGLAGDRSGLWFEFRRCIDELRPRWVVIENVPGLLSSNGGQDFATILGGLVELGYGVCWRILDAQYFGVAQRRRRVFIVGHLGGGRSAEVLFERAGVRGDPPARRAAGEGVAGTLGGGASGERGYRNDLDTAKPLTASYANSPSNAGFNPSPGNVVLAPTLTENSRNRSNPGSEPLVRRLTPRECERLQGFPDDWTAGQADSHRYRQMGNAVAVPVAEWIARRIMEAM